MQASTTLPHLAGASHEPCANRDHESRECRGRLVTYQVAFRGSDGMVIASDRKEYRGAGDGDEGSGPTTNLMKKLRIDSTGRFAWAYAGGEMSPIAAQLIRRELESGANTSNEAIENMLRISGTRSWVEAPGPNRDSTILFVDGATKQIWRAKLLRDGMTTVDALESDHCVAGQTYNLASFWPQAGYSKDLPVDRLVPLAAYMLFIAHQMDPLLVEGADIAIFRDAVGRFEFVPSDEITAEASRLASGVRQVIAG